MGYVYQKKTRDGELKLDNIYIMYKVLSEDGIYQHRSHEGEIFESLEDFTDISEEVLGKVIRY